MLISQSALCLWAVHTKANLYSYKCMRKMVCYYCHHQTFVPIICLTGCFPPQCSAQCLLCHLASMCICSNGPLTSAVHTSLPVMTLMECLVRRT